MMGLRVLTVALLTGAMLGCEKGPQPTTEKRAAAGNYDFALPSDAVNVMRTTVGKSEQLAFAVQRKFPAFAFPDEVLMKLDRDGWKRCPSTSDEWSSFGDATSGALSQVHQKVMHLKRGDTVLVLAGRYASPLPAGTRIDNAAAPSSGQQSGNVLALKGSSEELDEALKIFAAKC